MFLSIVCNFLKNPQTVPLPPDNPYAALEVGGVIHGVVKHAVGVLHCMHFSQDIFIYMAFTIFCQDESFCILF